MRKKAIVLLAGVILILSMVAVAGCGSGNSAAKAKAREYMEEGDGYISEYESSSGNMMGNRGEMHSPEEGFPGGGPPAEGSYPGEFSDEEMEERRSEMEARQESSKENLEKAKASYQKILLLDDAEEYKEYAEVMMELVDAHEGNMEMREEMTSGFEGADRQADFGTSDMQEMASQTSTYREEIDNLKDEAEKIKEENNL